jgi:NADH:quinone reductase (non-electrogenic)
MARHHVVIIGSGFGGLTAAKALKRADVDVTLISKTTTHLFQPLLYQVATGILSEGDIAPTTRLILRKQQNVRVLLGDVIGIDLGTKTVTSKLIDMVTVTPYDSLIVAAGASQSYFGHDEFALFAPGMKTIDDALELRRRIFGAFEMAEISSDADEQRAWLTVVVVGAGPTGVELAGQVRELASRSLRGDFRAFDPRSMRVLVVDGGDEPLATFGSNLSRAAARELHGLGVELQMGARVTGVDMMGVDVTFKDGSTDRITARTVIWAAGVQASPLAAKLATACGAQVDHAGRIEVLPDLTLPGHPEVFAVGDMTSLDGLPGVAEVAMQGSLHAAHTIGRRLRGLEDAKPFRYRDLGSVATIGRFRAIFSWRGIRLSGTPAWVVWAFVHLAFLNGFASRFTTMVRWIRWMVGTNRVERTFSVGHTGGDLSAPESVRQQIMPTPFPEINAIVPPPDQPS